MAGSKVEMQRTVNAPIVGSNPSPPARFQLFPDRSAVVTPDSDSGDGGSNPSPGTSLIQDRLAAGQWTLNPLTDRVRIPLLEPDLDCEVRTAASTKECHSFHTGSSPVLRSSFSCCFCSSTGRARDSYPRYRCSRHRGSSRTAGYSLRARELAL